MVRLEGGNPHLGLALAPMLVKAGLQVQKQWAQAIFAGYEEGIHHPLHEIVKFIPPRIVELGLATEDQMDVPTLEDRLGEERRGRNSSYLADVAVCVVATQPT